MDFIFEFFANAMGIDELYADTELDENENGDMRMAEEEPYVNIFQVAEFH